MDEDAERHAQEPEVVDGELVLASARAIEPVRPAGPPLRQVAAVAATGFVAGAATAAVLGRHRSRRRERAPAPAADVAHPVLSRRFVVYVR
jgi:hypothetical protein